jgi:hypothetical protein
MESTDQAPPKKPRNWRSISLRAMLGLILLVGIPTGWWAGQAHQQKAARARIEAVNGSVVYRSEVNYADGTVTAEASDRVDQALQKVGIIGFTRPPAKPRPPELFKDWARRTLGVDFVDSVTHVIIMMSDKVKDEDLKALGDLPKLKYLELSQSKLTEPQIHLIGQLPQLEILGLTYTRTDDADLARLKGLKNLRELFLDGTQITDAGLVELERLPGLQKLSLLYVENITEEGIERLRKALPKLEIQQ